MNLSQSDYQNTAILIRGKCSSESPKESSFPAENPLNLNLVLASSVLPGFIYVSRFLWILATF
jgi:hypothetical protein